MEQEPTYQKRETVTVKASHPLTKVVTEFTVRGMTARGQQKWQGRSLAWKTEIGEDMLIKVQTDFASRLVQCNGETVNWSADEVDENIDYSVLVAAFLSVVYGQGVTEEERGKLTASSPQP